MQIRAYKYEYKRCRFLEDILAAADYAAETGEKLSKTQREDLKAAAALRKLRRAVDTDPNETAPIEIPDDEFDALNYARYRYGNAETRRAMEDAG